MLLELVHGNTMQIAVIEKIGGILPYKVTFNNLIPGQANEAYMFYPSGYLKAKMGNPLYPDDTPENILNQISYDTNHYLISDNYDGEYLIIYQINNKYYQFTFEILNNTLIKVNKRPVNFDESDTIWFEKIDDDLNSVLKVKYYDNLSSNIFIQQRTKSLNSKLIVTKNQNLISNIDIYKQSNINSNINVTNYESINGNISIKYHVDTLCNLYVQNNKSINGNILVVRNHNLNSNIKIYNHGELISNLIVTNTNDLNSKINIKNTNNLHSIINILYSDDIDSNIVIGGSAKLISNVIVKHYNEMPTSLEVINSSNCNGKIIIMKSNDIPSNIFVTKFNDLDFSIAITHFEDIYTSIFTRYREFSIMPSNIMVTKYNVLESNIAVDRTANQIKSSITIKPWVKNNLNSSIFIIGKGNTNIPSKLLTTYTDTINSKIFIIKYQSLKSKLIIKPKHFNFLSSNVKIIINDNLYSRIYINPTDVLSAQTNINIEKNSSIKITLNIPTNNNLTSKINIVDKEIMYADLNVVSSNQIDLYSSLNIPSNNSIDSNIYINNYDSLFGESNIVKSGNITIPSLIKIFAKDDLRSTISIPFNSMMIGHNEIQVYYNAEINSNIRITTIGIEDISSTININCHDIIGANIETYGSYTRSLQSLINIKNCSILNSNIIIQPNGESKGKLIITGNRQDFITSKIIPTIFTTLSSKIEIAKTNIIYGLAGIIGDQDNSGIESNIIINSVNNYKELESNINISITPNGMDGTISILKISQEEVIMSNINIINKLDLNSKIFVSQNNRNLFDAKIIIDPRIFNNLESNIHIMLTNDMNSNITVNLLNKAYAMLYSKMVDINSFDSTILIKNNRSLFSNIKIINKNSFKAMIESFSLVTFNKFTPVKDSFIRQQDPTTNFGKSLSLYVGNHPDGISNTILGFQCASIESNEPIYSAKLILNSADYNNISNLTVFSINDSWDEHGITWKNQPMKGEKISSVANTFTDRSVIFDVTNYVKEAISNNHKNIDMMISQEDNSFGTLKRFYSKDSNKTPMLYVTYVKDITKIPGKSILPSNISIRTDNRKDLKSSIIINRYDDVNNIHCGLYVVPKDTMYSQIVITKETLTSNIIVRKNMNTDLASEIIINKTVFSELYSFTDTCGLNVPSNVRIKAKDRKDTLSFIQIKQKDISSLNSHIEIKGSTKLCNIVIRAHDKDDLSANLISRVTTGNNLQSRINVMKTTVPTKLVITWRNTRESKITIQRTEIAQIASKITVTINGINSKIIVTTKESRFSNIIIRSAKYDNLDSTVYVQPVGKSDILMNLKVRHQGSYQSKITITRPRIRQNIIIRRTEVSDLPSTIRIYVFEGYIYIM